MHARPHHITLADAAKITPGRPSTNCLWRWCRRGVLSRNGQRIRLEHIRIGGRIFTTHQWVEAFGKAVAEADACYFDFHEPTLQEGKPNRRRIAVIPTHQREDAREQADRELEKAGL